MAAPYKRDSVDISRARHPGSQWIDDHRASLPKNSWVAASANGLEAQNAEIQELMSELSRKRISVSDVAIAYITSDAV